MGSFWRWHKEYLKMGIAELLKPLRKQRNNVVVDVKERIESRQPAWVSQVLETLEPPVVGRDGPTL